MAKMAICSRLQYNSSKMRFRLKLKFGKRELDMTPMIDVVFLLIVFFTLVINFTAADQNERIRLPISELAQPPEHPPTDPVTLHVLANGDVIYDGIDHTLRGLEDPTSNFAHHLRSLRFVNVPAENITVIIRADAQGVCGQVFDVIELCQRMGLTKFVLRTRQQEESL